jgi:hypothetical protein
VEGRLGETGRPTGCRLRHVVEADRSREVAIKQARASNFRETDTNSPKAPRPVEPSPNQVRDLPLRTILRDRSQHHCRFVKGATLTSIELADGGLACTLALDPGE